MDKRFAGAFFSFGADLRSKSAYISGKETAKQLQENPYLRWRKRAMKGENFVTVPSDDKASRKPGYMAIIVLPFVLHLGFMAATSFFVMHVQVATRFLSASPPLYWFASYVMVFPGVGNNRWGYFIWAYCAAYILLGSLLFSNFYPFT